MYFNLVVYIKKNQLRTIVSSTWMFTFISNRLMRENNVPIFSEILLYCLTKHPQRNVGMVEHCSSQPQLYIPGGCDKGLDNKEKSIFHNYTAEMVAK